MPLISAFSVNSNFSPNDLNGPMAASLAKAVMSLPELDHWIKNSFLIRLDDSFSPFSDLEERIESISSTNTIAGDNFLASKNKARTNFSDSPKYFDVKEDAEILKNVDLDSVATALASMVLPVPGGPNRSIPLAGSLNPLNKSGPLVNLGDSDLERELEVGVGAFKVLFDGLGFVALGLAAGAALLGVELPAAGFDTGLVAAELVLDVCCLAYDLITGLTIGFT
ncbi:hypothetical protein WICPIJ_005549 [Wickerhamomyces pijperi]|uniref:Uncharacterized protein n=1 Tax=Wickerhamomyces pijperi TaxID=599730 RepID=A0A9P8TLV0_WICPI|nr:hypothetical protein WICPIJ_005549 [Wickerhamomyces pijperi]